MNTKLLTLSIIISCSTLLTLAYAGLSDSQETYVISAKSVYDDKDSLLAIEKELSDKTYEQTIYSNFSDNERTKTLDIETRSIPDGSLIIDGSITIPVIDGNQGKKCKLYSKSSYLNEESLTPEFTCNGLNQISLNDRGLDILTTKLTDDNLKFIVKSNDGLEFNIDETDIVLNLNFKKPQYFAKLDSNNIVENVIVADDQFIAELGGNWIETFTDGQRNNFASKGFLYDPIRDIFITPQPYESWQLNQMGFWEAPIPYPKDGNDYVWNELKLTWDLI